MRSRSPPFLRVDDRSARDPIKQPSAGAFCDLAAPEDTGEACFSLDGLFDVFVAGFFSMKAPSEGIPTDTPDMVVMCARHCLDNTATTDGNVSLGWKPTIDDQ